MPGTGPAASNDRMSTVVLERPPVADTSPSVVEQVEVRPLHSHEEHLVQHVFDALDQRSRSQGFGTPVARLSPTLRRTLTRSEPGERVALVALGRGRAVGVGHWVRDQHDPGTAVVTLAVVDAVQGRGVGRRLAYQLARTADRQGVDWFRCAPGADDRWLRSWLLASGGRGSEGSGDVLVHVRTLVARTVG